MNRLLNKHRFDVLLGMSILILAVAMLYKRATPSLTGAPKDAADSLAESSEPQHIHAPSTLIGYGGVAAAPVGVGWHNVTASCPLRRKSAVRLVELRDVFVVSIAACDLDTNSVQVSLKGSVLTIAACSGPHGELRSQNNIMLPVRVDATVAPEVSLSNDLLQIRIAKPHLAGLPGDALVQHF